MSETRCGACGKAEAEHFGTLRYCYALGADHRTFRPASPAPRDETPTPPAAGESHRETQPTKCADGQCHAATWAHGPHGYGIQTTHGGLRSTCIRCGVPIVRTSLKSAKWLRADDPAPAAPLLPEAVGETDGTLDILENVVGFAYDHGYHEHGYPLVELVRDAFREASERADRAEAAIREALNVLRNAPSDAPDRRVPRHYIDRALEQLTHRSLGAALLPCSAPPQGEET